MKKYKDISDCTKDWQRYENGKSYNRKLKPSYYDNVTLNWDFYNGNQYPGLEDVDAPKPVFNIINRIVNYFVSALTTNGISVNIEPSAFIHDYSFRVVENAAEVVNAHVDNLFEQFRMPYKIRQALIDGAVSGDYCAHLYFDLSKQPYGGMFNESGYEGEICLEMVDGNNVYFGNANSSIVSKDTQPYIIIAGRDTVDNLVKEAESYKNKDVTISGDSDYEEQVGQGGQIEIEADSKETDKATYIIIYKPSKDGKTITVSKSVQNVYIYENIDTGLSEYPIAWANWESQKNQYHGKALVTGIIPNQIYINRMFAILMYFLMNNAFQKPVYDADKITSWTSEVGVALPVTGLQPGESVRNVAAYLDNGQANPQVVQTIELAKTMTFELLGATDAALGNVNPENTSAIIAVTKQSAIPLENPRAATKEWINDITKIMLDMMATKYGQRKIVVDVDGQKQVVDFDFTQLKGLYLNTNIQIGDGSYYSEVGKIQTLDNLLAADRINMMQYFERVNKVNPDYIPDIDGLIADLKAIEEQQMLQAEEEAMSDQMVQFVQSLPEEQQAMIAQLPEEQQIAEIQAMMGA